MGEKVKLIELGPWNQSVDDNSNTDHALKMTNWPSLSLLLPEDREHILQSGRSFQNTTPNDALTQWQRGAQQALCDKYQASDYKTLLQTDNEFSQVVRSNGCSHHDRWLQWTIMEIASGCQFPLHAHPNLELIFCFSGALHEIRMQGPPYTRYFLAQDDTTHQLVGPSIHNSDRTWKFDTLSCGQWLVNEIGSIHKSFTATNYGGCRLLVLWGGSHANIPTEPDVVTKAVDTVEQHLKQCSCQADVTQLPAVFVPPSRTTTTTSSLSSCQ